MARATIGDPAVRHFHLPLVRTAICVLSAVIAPAARALDDYERGEQFAIGLAKLVACFIILLLVLRNGRQSDA